MTQVARALDHAGGGGRGVLEVRGIQLCGPRAAGGLLDARFELAHDDARNAMVLSQAADRPGSHRTRELMRASGI
ncbi:MAG: hypothetical protein ACRDNO_33800, partial [Trebonia sp.]